MSRKAKTARKTVSVRGYPVHLPIHQELLQSWYEYERRQYLELGGPPQGQTHLQAPGPYPVPPYPSAGPTEHVRWILGRSSALLVIRSLDELRALYWSYRVLLFRSGRRALPLAGATRKDLEYLLCARNVNPLDVAGWS